MKSSQLTQWILMAILLAGCASPVNAAAPRPTLPAAPPPSPTPIPTQPPTPTPAASCSEDALPDFSAYDSWSLVNAAPIEGHESMVKIYANELAREVYLSAAGDPFPTCAAIAKTHLLVTGDGSELVTALAVMVKLPPGYDPDHNDWWWGLYDAQGRVPRMTGRVEECIACHLPVAAADYVFSQQVLEEIQK